MSNSPIVYRPREDATPQGELSALAAVYAYLLKSRSSEKAAETSGGENHGRKELDDSPARGIIPEHT